VDLEDLHKTGWFLGGYLAVLGRGGRLDVKNERVLTRSFDI